MMMDVWYEKCRCVLSDEMLALAGDDDPLSRCISGKKNNINPPYLLASCFHNHVNDILKWVSNLVTDAQTISNQEITSDNKSGT